MITTSFLHGVGFEEMQSRWCVTMVKACGSRAYLGLQVRVPIVRPYQPPFLPVFRFDAATPRTPHPPSNVRHPPVPS